jgi:bifunctional ADP-heptose synthase (sugar kinase/adenylyltransferase)
MILTFDELEHYRGRVAMVDGAFDPLHHGHIEYFRAAADYLRATLPGVDVPLFCNVASDDYVRGKHAPLLSEDHRAIVIDAIRYISFTHVNRHDTETILRTLRPRYYVKGKDWAGRLPPAQVEICAEHNIGIVCLPTALDSSSRILQQFLDRQNTA